VKPGESIAGSYKLDAAAPPGQYVFGVVAKVGGREFAQWLDFEVVNQ
jgi:hypothetical protein